MDYKKLKRYIQTEIKQADKERRNHRVLAIPHIDGYRFIGTAYAIFLVPDDKLDELGFVPEPVEQLKEKVAQWNTEDGIKLEATRFTADVPHGREGIARYRLLTGENKQVWLDTTFLDIINPDYSCLRQSDGVEIELILGKYVRIRQVQSYWKLGHGQQQTSFTIMYAALYGEKWMFDTNSFIEQEEQVTV